MHLIAMPAVTRTEKTSCTFFDRLGRHNYVADLYRHCSEGDVEVSLSRAGAESHSESSSSTSSSSAVGEAVDCHSHAGVE